MTLRRQRCLALLGGLLLVGCDSLESDCVENPQWCMDFSLQPLGLVNRADPSARLAVRIATENATKLSAAANNFWVSIEQAPTGLPRRDGRTELPTPSALDSGWDVALAKPLPELKELHCGPAKLYLHARLLKKPNQYEPWVPSTDLASTNYQQHGAADFTIFDQRQPQFQTPGMGKLQGGSGLLNLGLHNGPPLAIYATQDEDSANNRPISLGLGTLALPDTAISSPAAVLSTQFVGQTNHARLVLTLGNRISSCGGNAAVLRACSELTTPSDVANDAKCPQAAQPFPWCFPAKSTAADVAGTYFASIDSGGLLRVYGLDLTAADKKPTFSELKSLPGYRHVSIGDIDGDGVMDVLALGQSMSPLVLLRDQAGFKTNTQSVVASRWETELAKHPAAMAADAVATIGSLDGCDDHRPSVLLASNGAVYAFTQQQDRSLQKKQLVLQSLPTNAAITALLLADTDSDKTADLLLVAVQPDTLYVYRVQ